MLAIVSRFLGLPPAATRLAFSVQAGLFLAVGIGRFSYTVIVPGLIEAEVVTAVEAGYVGGANLLGYLIGATLVASLTREVPALAVLRISLALSVLSFFACAVPLGFLWLLSWRALIGVTAALIMVRAISLTLALVPASLLGRALGIAFSGVGLGTIVSGLFVPSWMKLGADVAWLGLAVIGGLSAVIAWSGWTGGGGPVRSVHRSGLPKHVTFKKATPFAWLVSAHFLFGFGMAPPTIYWVDFISRVHGQGLASGGLLWSVVGVGALVGPILCGLAAERFGFKRSLIVALVILGVAIGWPLLRLALPWLIIGALILGALNPGLSTLMSGRTGELAPSFGLTSAWGRMTFSVAVGHGLGGLVTAILFALSKSYEVVFLLGSACMILAAWAVLQSSARWPK